ncbi:Enamine deaminase RidA, house cleaning of reactive enamine intermediates, YjgF/YER057c/UK114 family [Micromonospora halophytica]|uniref:Enamine deaminase RidA, house cleaning of reactive enamine intermediates, YjgF/YER057c/UK114 family n=1 Tax=Micromonospora halophytica TaxID=47864 RepID=A0A1C5GUM8_9ACTN|nr:Enamine deaminase RidA, house cleaning of reactive enamine intermediates, YjgF/YER057c/UK114 family [Micromonospora halophytica]
MPGGPTVTRLGSGGPWEARYGYSRVVRVGDRVLTAGCTSTVDGEVAHVGDAAAQTAQALRIALDALAEVGASVADVVRTRMYVVDRRYADEVGRAHNAVFGAVRPAATMVVVAGLLHPDHLVEVELEAYLAAA